MQRQNAYGGVLKSTVRALRRYLPPRMLLLLQHVPPTQVKALATAATAATATAAAMVQVDTERVCVAPCERHAVAAAAAAAAAAADEVREWRSAARARNRKL